MKLPAWLWTSDPPPAPDVKVDESVVFPGLPDRGLSPSDAALLLERGQLNWRTLSVVMLELMARDRLHLRDRYWTGRGGYDLQVVTTQSIDALTYDPNMSSEGANLLALLGPLAREDGYLSSAARTPDRSEPYFPEPSALVQAITRTGSAAFRATAERSGLLAEKSGGSLSIASQTETGAWTKGELIGLKNLLAAAYAGTTVLSAGEMPSGPAGLEERDRLVIWSVALGLEQPLYAELNRPTGGLYAGWKPAWCRDIAPISQLETRGAAVWATISLAEEMLGRSALETASGKEVLLDLFVRGRMRRGAPTTGAEEDSGW